MSEMPDRDAGQLPKLYGRKYCSTMVYNNEEDENSGKRRSV